MKSKVFLLFVAASIFALVSSKSIKKVKSITDININKETDFVLRHVDKLLKKHGLDPYPIPMQKFNISHGYIELMQGSLDGLSSWIRSDDAYYHETSSTVTLPFKIKNITIQSDYNIHLLIKDNLGSWSANVEDFCFNFDVFYNQAASNISFNSIVINKIGAFNPSITGAFSSEIAKEIHHILKGHTVDQIIKTLNRIIADNVIPWINEHLPNHI